MIYLNSGTHSLSPISVREAVERYRDEYETNPTANLFQAWGKLWKVQKELAEFFGARATDMFLRPNVTSVLNDLVLGLELAPGSEILLSDMEYGAIANLCRFKAERDGLKTRTFHLPVTPAEVSRADKAGLVKAVTAAIQPQTKAVLISHIVTGNGMILPIEEIAAETRKRGVLLIVDGAHAPGSIPLDFSKLGDVDFYGGNLHKWMMGPKGTSFGWVNERNHDLLKPIHAGWTTFEAKPPFDQFGGGSIFQYKMLMSSCVDFAPYFAIHETLEYWRAKSPEKIFARINKLKAFARDEVHEKLDWPCLSPAKSELHGPLVSFELPPKLQDMGFGLMEKLWKDHEIQIMTAPLPALGGKFCLRLSPHIYNTENDIRETVAVLRKYA